MRYILGLLLCLAALPASAQINIQPQPLACAPPNFLGWTGTTWTCLPATGVQGPAGPAGPIGATGPQGPAGSGGGCTFVPSLEPAGRPITILDQCKLLIYTGTTPSVFTFPVPSIALVVCIKAAAAGQVQLQPVASIYGGFVKLDKPQDECVSNDGAGKWVLWTGVSPAVANPNAVQ